MDAKHDQSDLTCAADWASLVQLLTMGSRQLRRIFGQQTAALAINETQFLVLFACRQCDAGLCQSDLAVRAGLSTAQVSGLVEQLEHRGLLEVRRSTVDRRRRVCRASPAGAEVLEQGLKQLAPLARQVRDQIGQVAQDELQQALGRLLRLSTPALDTSETSDTLNSTSNSPPIRAA